MSNRDSCSRVKGSPRVWPALVCGRTHACWICRTRVPEDLLGTVYRVVLYWTSVWLLEGLEGLNHLGMYSWSLRLFLHIFSFIRPLEDLKPCLGINEISSSFFSLLLEILLLEGQASLPMVRVLEKSDVHQSFQIVERFNSLQLEKNSGFLSELCSWLALWLGVTP